MVVKCKKISVKNINGQKVANIIVNVIYSYLLNDNYKNLDKHIAISSNPDRCSITRLPSNKN